MKIPDRFRPFVPAVILFGLFLGATLTPMTTQALPLDTSVLNGRTFRGNDADDKKILCSMEISKIRKSPSNKRFRNVEYIFGPTKMSMIDFDPKTKLMLMYYNPKGWYGYEVWFRNYGDDNHYLRIWMNYMASNRVPASLQMYSESKKTGLKRLISDCVNLR